MTDQQPSSESVRTAVERERDHLKEGLDAIIGVIDKYSDEDEGVRPDSSMRDLKQIARSVAEDSKELLEDGRLLRLGIVGQVKAGKSSLLNLLLFDGQEVLPKAATPMTASLTHIVKSDRDEIEIEYYTVEDWKGISDHAREYEQAKKAGDRDIDQFMEAAAQLVEMADKKGINVRDHLGKNVVHQVPSAELNDKLRRFVGSNGDMTPLVKSVTIRSSQGMADLDIVDTPGINDPIASRSRQAMQMLGPCDAVLMLSYAGQFMGEQDVKFFKGRIPSEGIEHCLVIGSKFDSALVDVSRDHRGRLDEAIADTEQSLKALADEAVAKHSLEDVLDTDDGNDGTVDVVLASAMCAALGKRPYGSWAPDERHTFDRLQRAYPDWFDQPDLDQDINETTRDHLVWVGNRAAVDDILKDVRTKKDGIMAGKVTNFLREKHAQALEELAELIRSLEEGRAEVEDGDIEAIERQQESIEALREDLETQVTFKWEELVENQGISFNALRDEIRNAVAGAREKIQGVVTTEVRTKRKKKKGLFNAAKRLFNAESGYETKTYEKKVLDDAALETAIRDFCDGVEDEVDEVVEKMYDWEFKKSAITALRNLVADVFSDELGAIVNKNALRRSLREAISRIVDDADKRLKNTSKSLFNDIDLSFSYGGHSAEGGQDEGREFVKTARDQITKWLKSCKKQIDAVQDQAKVDLVPVTVDELNKYQERLKQDLAKREFTLQRYDLALGELRQARLHLENSTGTNGG